MTAALLGDIASALYTVDDERSTVERMHGLAVAHADGERLRRGLGHVGPVVCTEGWWACEWGEAESSSRAQFHGACRACVLAAAALAVNGVARSQGVIAYVGPDGADPGLFVVIRLLHFTAFYNAHRERHGLPFLLHDDDHVYGWGWS